VIVIALLRFFGLVNAAVWFGAACFFIFVAEPALTGSDAMQTLLGPKSFPYFSVAAAQILGTRFYTLFLLCALLAMLHVGAEWLYFGKYPRRVWLLLIFGLFLGGLAQNYGIQPVLKERLLLQHTASTPPEQRDLARRSFRSWNIMAAGVNLLLLSGLGVYLWHVANPPDEMRFLGTAKFPGQFRS
jgi:hypothetical protein